MELFQNILIRAITGLFLTASGRIVDEPGSADSYLNKSDGTFVKPIIVGGQLALLFYYG